ncbi:hypothetical protein DW098_00600 [Ruminococcus sp. AM07-21]|jgi:hypothetical protein|nr:hypothetical protein DW098_00600 [Ruminococcus sp. AM07-21]RHP59866.1 hypothetical protein DWZ27_00600 [Ruminococcus sp. AF31-16BH]DAU00437.1 MAG TPA: Head Tail Connector Protein [Caudoviricetes sp.]
MAYADEEYYTSMWMTGTIPAENLKGYLSKASMEIDNMTFGRLRKGLPEDPYYQDKIRSAVCETADLLYSYNVADNLAMQALKEMNSKDISEKGIKSISDGTESVTYNTGSDLTSQAKAMFPELASTREERSKAVSHVIRRYLTGIPDTEGINLLYAGVM